VPSSERSISVSSWALSSEMVKSRNCLNSVYNIATDIRNRLFITPCSVQLCSMRDLFTSCFLSLNVYII